MEHKRYKVVIQNPQYSCEVFVWDKVEREKLTSYPYNGNYNIAATQQEAKRKCYEWVEEYLNPKKQSNFEFERTEDEER